MKTPIETAETDYLCCRQLHPRGIVEFRWNTAGGEILGHRNERLIAEIRETLYYQAACPQVMPPVAIPGRTPSAARRRFALSFSGGFSGV